MSAGTEPKTLDDELEAAIVTCGGEDFTPIRVGSEA
jgi:hypothetical protein